MGYRELIEALKAEGDEKIRTIRQEAETEAAALRTEAARRIEHIRRERVREQSRAVREQENVILSETAAEARAVRLRAEQELSDRLYRSARASLASLRAGRYDGVFAALAREIPQHPWGLVKVHPLDAERAKALFPDAAIVPDETITGGIEVADRDGAVRVVNTFESRLDRAWPELLPGLIRELEREAGTKTPGCL